MVGRQCCHLAWISSHRRPHPSQGCLSLHLNQLAEFLKLNQILNFYYIQYWDSQLKSVVVRGKGPPFSAMDQWKMGCSHLNIVIKMFSQTMRDLTM